MIRTVFAMLQRNMEIRDMERRCDKKLHIRTAGRDDSAGDSNHHAYEPTPYAVLERLAQSGWIGRDSVLLDYGCGKGRAGIYLSHATGCRSIGIDFSEKFVLTARKNLQDYSGDRSRITFQCESAERYVVPPEVDCFFFFNPFSEKILRSVTGRILESWYAAPRPMRLFFYYPSDEYVATLSVADGLCFADEINCSDLFPGDDREKILYFELS